jgi:D-beta-D-heptose 7-phosphate kinase/D-beta-D-heptose 1-phosphate adenosyltransferase
MMDKFEKSSIIYHNIFNFPLTKKELVKWKSKTSVKSITGITSSKGYYFIKGRKHLIGQRLRREKISVEKMKIAKKAAAILAHTPTVKMVAVTGSLAMMNASENGDIDLMIITKKDSLWTTRLFAYLSFVICHLSFRRSFDSNQKDALCLNMWLDESDLVWEKSDRNLYTAHEIAQIVPLVNKDKTYEKFIFSNKWILNFWPNSVKIGKWKIIGNWKMENGKFNFLEKINYWIQYNHMKPKITREIISPTRALFHPHDWGKVVLKKLSS